MVARHCSVEEAYNVLGLEQGVSLEEVKSTYRQLALRTHPDKNPGNADATAEFQRLSEAYRVLLKHHDRSSRQFDDYSHDDDDYDDYSDDDDDDDDFDLDFHLFVFAELLKGRFAYRRRYRGEDTEEQHQEHVKRMCEAQVAAEERRHQENAARKVKQEKERVQDRLEAERRQKAKQSQRKAKAQSDRKVAEKAMHNQQQLSQATRSAVFAAARSGKDTVVKKGIWEDGVDATGGEIKPGHEAFAQHMPQDPQETLLHIAAKNGNTELVEWLDNHSADPEERNTENLTALHIALRNGHIAILRYFLKFYPPTESEHKPVYETRGTDTLLSFALDSNEPEIVKLGLGMSLATAQDIHSAWARVSSNAGMEQAKSAEVSKKMDIIREMLMTFGGFTPPPTPTVGPRTREDSGRPSPIDGSFASEMTNPSLISPSPVEHQNDRKPPPEKKQSRSSHVNGSFDSGLERERGKGKGRGRGRGLVGRGRGRGRGRGTH